MASAQKLPLRIGLAGLGVVGTSLARCVQRREDLRLVAVAVRDPKKPRAVDLSSIDVLDDPQALVLRDDVDVVVELIGGVDGPAHALVQSALSHNKPVVTANKALLATHGGALSHLARATQTPLLFEAAVGGGVPMIKVLREGLCANRVDRIAGILNGTCNDILTRMEETGQDFATCLRQAQDLGYAEPDPTLDIDGIDTAHKLAILVALVTGQAPDLSAISVTGIRAITSAHIRHSADKGYRIKLLARYQGGEPARVGPVLVARAHPLAQLNGPFNALSYQGDLVGAGFLSGRGAGGDPTASAVLADLLDVMAGRAGGRFGLPDGLGSQVALASSSPTTKEDFDSDIGLPIWK